MLGLFVVIAHTLGTLTTDTDSYLDFCHCITICAIKKQRQT